jgi:23S rRNA pseudouridine1911/1915/1917 synthase
VVEFPAIMAKKESIGILYQDADIIVVNKPTGLSVTKDRSHDEEFLPALIKQLGLAPKERLLLVHRLDKETSGIMMLAKHKDAQRQYSAYFSKGTIKKTYLALVSGAVTQDEGTIEAPIGNDRRDPRRMCIDFGRRGKKAVTNWRLLADFGGATGAALVAVSPVTGRTHQIRVHLPSVGMPLVIDPLYGNDEGLMLSSFKSDYRLGKWQEEKPLIDRLTLHAYQIELPQDALHGQASLAAMPPVFVAKLDKHFAAAIKMLAKHNRQGYAAFKNPDTLETILEGKPL